MLIDDLLMPGYKPQPFLGHDHLHTLSDAPAGARLHRYVRDAVRQAAHYGGLAAELEDLHQTEGTQFSVWRESYVARQEVARVQLASTGADGGLKLEVRAPGDTGRAISHAWLNDRMTPRAILETVAEVLRGATRAA